MDILQFDETKAFAIFPKRKSLSLNLLMSEIRPKSKVWMSNEYIYQAATTIYHIKDDLWALRFYYLYFEHGLFISTNIKLLNNCVIKFSKENQLYNNIKDYRNDFKTHGNFTLSNFANVFRLFFLSNLVIFLFFIFNYFIS